MTDERRTDDVRSEHILVGIDGSDGSRAALAFAMDEAVLRDLPVRAVLAYDVPSSWVLTLGATVDLDELRRAAWDKAVEQVDSATSARTAKGGTVPPVEPEVHRGPTGAVLERLSRAANMLVVGHRGRGEAASMMIGSVGLNSVIHAHCTVVVVRGL